jgi:uncharacterized protein (DUF58 family)
MNGGSLRRNAFLLITLTVLAAIGGDWSGDAGLAVLWRFPAALLLLGLAYESWLVSRAGIRIAVETPNPLYLGRGAVMRMALRHQLQRPLAIEVLPAAPESFDSSREVARLRIRADCAGEFERSVTATRLGACSWPQVPIRVAGPLGLAWWPQALNVSCEVQVQPDLLRSAAEFRGIADSGPQARLDGGSGAEVLRLREYRLGDPPRVVDWKATARSGRLISRDFAQDDGLSVIILIDAGRASALRAGALDRFGHYANVASRLAQFAAERDDLVGLIVYADRPLAALAPSRGTAAVARMRALLTAMHTERAESNPLFAATRVRSLVRHRSLVVFLTDVDDASAESQLTQAVTYLLPKHLPFIAGLSSAAAETMARAPAHQWLDPYRSLAAQEYCVGLERKVRALNARGAPALVARPEHLEQAVFAAYAKFRRQRRA